MAKKSKLKPQAPSRSPGVAQGVIWGLAGLSVVVAIYSLLNQVVPHLHDIAPFLWAKAIHEAVEAGVMYPQWLPQFWHGFGLPIFQYYPPLFYTLVELAQQLGANAITSIKIILGLSLVSGGWFTYMWVKTFASRNAALVAGVVFILTPYYLSLIYLRGAFPEFFALNLLPILLWLTARLFKTKALRYFIGLIVAWVAIILSHNLITLVAGILYLAYIIYLYITEERNLDTVKTALGAGVVAALLTAFYWWPVFLTVNWINAGAFTDGRFHYSENFQGIATMINLGLQRLHGWVSLGPVHALILIMGWIGYREILDARKATRVLIVLIAATFFVFLVTPYSDFIWSLVPGMKMFQFPARFLGPGALLVGVLAGLLTDAFFKKEGAKRTFVAVLMTATLLTALPFSVIDREYRLAPNLTNEELNFERYLSRVAELKPGETRETKIVTIDRGVVAFEYMPRKLTKDQLSQLAQATIFNYATVNGSDVTFTLPDRVEVVDGDIQVTNKQINFLDFEATIDASSIGQVRINQLEFPRWQITLDGKPADIQIVDDEPGQFLDIPIGRHKLTVKFTTPPLFTGSRIFSGIVLLLTILGLIAFALYKRRNPSAKLTRHDKKVKNKKS